MHREDSSCSSAVGRYHSPSRDISRYSPFLVRGANNCPKDGRSCEDVVQQLKLKDSLEALKSAMKTEHSLNLCDAVKLYRAAYDKLLYAAVGPGTEIASMVKLLKKAQFCAERVKRLKLCAASNDVIIEYGRRRQVFVRRLPSDFDLKHVKDALYKKFHVIRHLEVVFDDKYKGFAALYIKCYSSVTAENIYRFLKCNLHFFKPNRNALPQETRVEIGLTTAEASASGLTREVSAQVSRVTPGSANSTVVFNRDPGITTTRQVTEIKGSWVQKLQAFKGKHNFI